MRDLIRVALAKGLAGDDLPKLAVGTHFIDEIVTLRIKGEINKAKDYNRKPTVSIPLKAVLALALEKAGVMRDCIVGHMEAAMREALELHAKGEEFIQERLKDVDAAMDRVTKSLDNLPKVPAAGATKVDLEIEELIFVAENVVEIV